VLIRLYFLLLYLCSSYLFALDITVQTGKEANEAYSIIHLRDSSLFLCESQKNSFNEVTQVICAFDKIPKKNIGVLNNNFFNIKTVIKDNDFFVLITPYEKIELFPILFDLKKDHEVFKTAAQRSKQWSVIGYKKKNPFKELQQYSAVSINFPVTFSNQKLPYIGGLDIKGNPIEMTQIKDVSEYIKIKKLYKLKKYEETLEAIDEMLQEYPDTVFKSEVALYKIRSLHQLHNLEALLGASKKFIREFSSDSNIAEVLAYTARAYSKLGMFTDADYFFDHLFNEQQNSYFTRLAEIYKGDQLADAGSWKKALNFYMKALNKTQDANIASIAAFKIAEYQIDHGSSDKAKEYIDKIVQGNSRYFYEHFSTSYKMAMAFSDRGDYSEAAQIAGALLAQMKPRDDLYEEIMKNRSIWLARAKKTKEALQSFDRYLNEFKFGQFVDEIKREKDAMFFDVNDTNVTQALQTYNTLIDRYGDDDIGKKALYKKAKLLYDNGQYRAVLALQSALQSVDSDAFDVKSLIDGAALELMQAYLKKHECKNAVSMSMDYNVTLSDAWDSQIYYCAYESGNYALAKTTALKYIKSKNVKQRMEWLYKFIEVDFKLGNYTDVLDAAKELITLQEVEKSTQYPDIYRLSFDANERLGNSEGMIEGIKKIEKVFGLDFKDIDRYAQLIALGNRLKDNTIVENYAKKVIYLQNKKGSYSQTPYVEFSLTSALVHLDKNSEAIEVIKSLDERNVTKASRARQKYLLGSLLQKNGKKDAAQEAYKQSMEADNDSAWASLAKDALELMK
jgi:tetratricopeptide (TPR) repeat protein